MNGTHVSFVGTPNSNSFAKLYQVEVHVSDNNTAVDDLLWYRSFQVEVNQRPTVSTMGSDTILVPDGNIWTFGASIASDPEGLPYTKTLYVDGSATIPSWFVYDLTNFEFRIVTSSNSIAGLHNIIVDVDDGISVPRETSFMLMIEVNEAPTRIRYINSISIVNSQSMVYHFEDVDYYFDDKDNRPMTYEITQANGDPLPYFISYNTIDQNMTVTPESVHVGEWVISYTAIDDNNNTASISFIVNVERKFFSVTFSLLLQVKHMFWRRV